MKVLADTSVWIGHLRSPEQWFTSLLGQGAIVGHPFITGEVMMGSLRNRRHVRDYLSRLPQLAMVSQSDVLDMVDHDRLFGRGIGYIDASLLASTSRSGCKVVTRDRRFGEAAEALGLRFVQP